MTVDSSTSLMRCFDAAFPPLAAPRGYGAVLGYLGGPLAMHTWSLGEWERFGHLIQFPAYVPDLDDNPGDQAAQAVKLALGLGWEPGRAIVADTETEVNRAWYQVWAAGIMAGSFVPVDYGSLDYALQNAAEIIWAADWNDTAQVPAGQAIWASQFEAGLMTGDGTKFDASVLHSELVRLGGRGTRRLK